MPPAPLLYLRRIDVLDQPAEALVYSNNIHLHCSGGVGAAMVDRHGPAVQSGLLGLLKGRRKADQGEIFEWVPPGMPHRAVLHTVPTDFWHNTTPEIVEDVLRRAMQRCAELGLRRVALSALATGYGDLMLKEFLLLADRVLAAPGWEPVEEITLCLNDPAAFALALKIVQSEHLHWQTKRTAEIRR